MVHHSSILTGKSHGKRSLARYSPWIQRVRHYLVIKEQQLYISNTFYSFLCHLKRPWCWERLRAGGEVDNRGWDGGMASPTQWTWVWVDSGSWWWTGRPGVLWFMESQRVRHDWATKLNWMVLSMLSHEVVSNSDLMDYSPPGSFVHGVFQARILEWIAISYSRESSWPRDWTYSSCYSCIGRWILYHCTTWEACCYVITYK